MSSSELLEVIVPVGSLLGMAGGFLGWAVGQARAIGRWEERIHQLQQTAARLESKVEELDRSRIDQGRRLGAIAPSRPTLPLPSKVGGG